MKDMHAGPFDHAQRLNFWQLTGYNTAVLVTVPLASLVDLGILGSLDDISIQGGVSLGAVIFELLFWGFGFLRMATTGLVAQASARQDTASIRELLVRSLAIAIIIGCVIIATSPWLLPGTLSWMGGSPEATQHALDYAYGRVLGAPAVLAVYVLTGWLLGLGQSKKVLWLTTWIHATNIAFDIIFIQQFGLDAYGAGLATSIAQAVGLTVALPWLWAFLFPSESRTTQNPFQLLRSILSLTQSIDSFKSMLALHADMMVRTLALVCSFVIFRRLSAGFGDASLDANAILESYVRLSAYVIDGMALTVETFAGMYWGSKQISALKRMARYAITASMFIAMAMSLLFMGGAEIWVSLFNRHRSVIDIALQLRAWVIPMILLGAPTWILDGYFIGTSQGPTLRNGMLISLVGNLLFLFYFHQTMTLLWASLIIMTGLRLLTLSAAFVFFDRAQI